MGVRGRGGLVRGGGGDVKLQNITSLSLYLSVRLCTFTSLICDLHNCMTS